MPDFQVLFNIAVGLAAFFGGFILNSIMQRIDKLETTDGKLVTSINEIKVTVATQGTQRTEDSKKLDSIFEKLEKIDEKLDRKADKQ